VNRRRFLAAGAALALTPIARAGEWLWNPCLEPRAPDAMDAPALQAIYRATFEGLDPAQLWDAHVHLAGVGDGDAGTWVNPRMDAWWHPVDYLRKRFYMNAACAETDAVYIERLYSLYARMPDGVRALLFAFDYCYREDGERDLEHSPFYVPNEYAAAVARGHPDRFEWVASVHPYRADAVAALQQAAADGARAVKWLPPVQGMDPASPRCDAFYAVLARLDLPLITHAGKELAVDGDTSEFGNPLRLRRALDCGVRVVIAHCASLGKSVDLDRGANAPRMSNFKLFLRLMDSRDHAGRVFGDIADVTARLRAKALPTLLERSDLHDRLLYGSDYPIAGVMPIISVSLLARRDLLAQDMVEPLEALRRHHPPLFDLALVRALRYRGKAFPPAVFQTRRFFAKP
jgi:mannonate dehydratase